MVTNGRETRWPKRFNISWPDVALVLLVAAFTFMVALGLFVWVFGAEKVAAKVLDGSGAVEVREAKGEWHPLAGSKGIEEGLEIKEGSYIRTGDDGSVTLIFEDDSTVTLKTGTTIGIWRDREEKGTLVLGLLEGGVRVISNGGFLLETPFGKTRIGDGVYDAGIEPSGAALVQVKKGEAEVISEGGGTIPLKEGDVVELADGVKPAPVAAPTVSPGGVRERVISAWESGEYVELTLTEDEVNTLIEREASETPELEEGQVWFLDGKVRVVAGITEPIHTTVEATVRPYAQDGKIRFTVLSISAGGLAIPQETYRQLLDEAEEGLSEAREYFYVDGLVIKPGVMTISGRKLKEYDLSQ